MSSELTRTKHPGGRPAGSPNTTKPWADAIRRAVHRTSEDGKTKRLDLLADVLVVSGLAGDVHALKEIGDRLDGKARLNIDARINRSVDDFSGEELDTLIAAAGLAEDEVVH